jgi:hypothetical protein
MKIHLKQKKIMQNLQGIHFVDFCFGFHFFLALPNNARILCLDSL